MSDHGLQVVGNAFELGVQRPREQRGGWHRTVGRRYGLDGLAESQGVSNRRDSLGPLGQEHPVEGAQALEPPFQAAVLVVNASTHMRNVFTGSFHEILDRFENA